VLVATVLLALPACYFAKDLRFDYSVLAMRDPETEAMSTLLELQADAVATDYSIAVLAADAAAAAALEAELEALPEVGAVQTPLDLVPRDQAQKRALLDPLLVLLEGIGPVVAGEGSDALSEALDYLREVEADVRPSEIEAYRGLVRGLVGLEGDATGLDPLNTALIVALQAELETLRSMVAAEPFEFDDLPEDLRRQLVTADGRRLLSVQPAGVLDSREATGKFIDAVAAVAPNVAGRAVVEWGVGDVAVEAFLTAVALSVALISGLLVLYFRSLVRALLVLLPLALATLFTFAVMELIGLSLNMANILVVPLVFGLGVDTGIHVVHRFAAGGGVRDVFQSSTARAVMISALTTIGTFFSLSFSPHGGAASVGLLLSIAISLMLLATFVVLPAVLGLFQRRS
jgi:predicted RND superfamily exporter protein